MRALRFSALLIFVPPLLSDDGAVFVNLRNDEVRDQDGHTAADCLEQAGSSRLADADLALQGLENESVEGADGIVQRSGHSLRYLPEQAEIGIENLADVEDEHDDDHRLDGGQGDVFGLLPLGGAVENRGFVEASVDAGDARQIHDHVVAHGFPGGHEHQNEGPVLGSGIPHHLFAAQAHDDAVRQALVGIEERIDKVADHDPRHEVGQEHHGLVALGGEPGIQLVDDNGQRDGNHQVDDDEHQIVQNGVAQQQTKGVACQEEFEVVKAGPVAVEQAVQKSLAGGQFKTLERDNQAEHRQIAEYHEPYGGGQAEQSQLCVVSGPSLALRLMGACGLLLIHKRAPFNNLCGF